MVTISSRTMSLLRLSLGLRSSQIIAVISYKINRKSILVSSLDMKWNYFCVRNMINAAAASSETYFIGLYTVTY